MGRNDVCFCGSGNKQKRCHPNIGENSLAADLIKFYATLENDIQEKISDGLDVICKKGCNECCYDFF